jgi:hypothetical protein
MTCPAAVRDIRPASSRGFQHGVVDLDEQVEQRDAGLLEHGAPRGAQERIGKVAPFGGGELVELDGQGSSWQGPYGDTQG